MSRLILHKCSNMRLIMQYLNILALLAIFFRNTSISYPRIVAAYEFEFLSHNVHPVSIVVMADLETKQDFLLSFIGRVCVTVFASKRSRRNLFLKITGWSSSFFKTCL